MDDQQLTVREVAQALRLSEQTIRRWIRLGKITPTTKFGDRGGWRIPRSEIERLLQRSR